jgi:S-adenosylmethionine decarboxylase
LSGSTEKSIDTNPTFGWELILDLYDCDPKIISDENEIKKFAGELCKVIDMKAFGDPLTPYFGQSQENTKGYSLLQFIETSSIVGHFSESTGAVYINIFSCKKYDIEKAEKFTKDFFHAKKIHSRFIVRD